MLLRLLLIASLTAGLAIATSEASALTLVSLSAKLKSPTAIAFRPGNLNPVIAEQGGRIVTLRQGKLIVLADLSDRVGQQGGEQGLLGIAYHPQYRENGLVYIDYTDAAGDTQIVRLQRGRYDRLLKASATTVLSIRQPYANHNGGQLTFGPDGLLYIGMGDGGASGDPANRAQSTNTLLGKVLRIDVDGGNPYAIPATNPFVAGGGLPEIWAIGLRNPWRFSFDRKLGALWLADVGEHAREEVNRLPKAAPALPNFGWNAWEGDLPYVPHPTPGTLIEPLAVYDHDVGCSIIGGYVYRGKAIPKLRGRYVFGDWCNGQLWTMTSANPTRTDTGLRIAHLSTFGQDDSGELYLASTDGRLFSLRP